MAHIQCPACSTTVLEGETECYYCHHPLDGRPAPEKQVRKPTRPECPHCGSESFTTREMYLTGRGWSSVRVLQISAAVSITMVVILACVVFASLSSSSASLVSLLAAGILGLRIILFYTSSFQKPRTNQYKCQNCGTKWLADTQAARSRGQ